MEQYTLADIAGRSHSFDVVVMAEMLDQFEILTGDANPLHTDPAYARERGHPDRVVYGMLTASFLSTLVGMYLPGRFAELQEVAVSFRNPVFPADRLTVRGTVVGVSEAARQIEIRAEVVNQKGVRVSRATIKAGIRHA